MARRTLRGVAAAAVALMVLSPSVAADLVVTVGTAGGEKVEDAVVVASPVGAVPKPRGDRPTVVVDQVDKEFVPLVTVVRTGATITFPNKDNIRHHVYSFSPAKTFELPLYKGVPAEPVVFDTPGLVVLGCNIHDWMIAWIYVVDSPWFAKTDPGGTARLLELPAGEYDVEVYHPRAKDPSAPVTRRVTIGASDPGPLAFDLALKAPRRSTRPPKGGDGTYP